jgi:hypothetical protein
MCIEIGAKCPSVSNITVTSVDVISYFLDAIFDWSNCENSSVVHRLNEVVPNEPKQSEIWIGSQSGATTFGPKTLHPMAFFRLGLTDRDMLENDISTIKEW